MEQLTEQQAIDIYNSGTWKDWTDEEIVKYQLFQRNLAMDFSRFHKAMEAVFERPIWTHEFANQEALIAEYLGEREAPTMAEIIAMIPSDKLILVTIK